MQLPDNIKKPRERAKAKLQLDANESPFNKPLNRYPSTKALQTLMTNWGKHEHIPERCIFMCNGIEEACDLLIRTFTVPNRDSIIAAEPTRHYYKRRAQINRIEYREANLRTENFELDANDIVNAISDTTQMIFLCSPNSPTGNLLDAGEIESIVQIFDGIVVVDESYIDFVPQATVIGLLNKYKNLVVLRSFSHAWALAGLNLSAIIAHPDIICNIAKIALSHPINTITINAALEMIKNRLDIDKWTRQIIDERTKVEIALKDIPECEHIYHSDANFLLVKFSNSASIYKDLLKNGIAVHPVMGCLRLTIGLPQDNSALLGALRRRNSSIK